MIDRRAFTLIKVITTTRHILTTHSSAWLISFRPHRSYGSPQPRALTKPEIEDVATNCL